MKGIFLTLVCAFALTSATEDSDVPVNNLGCPIDTSIDWLLPHETYCNLFYKCVFGTPVSMKCADKTAFNTVKNVCDWIDQVDCGPRTLYVEENKTDSVEEEVTEKALFGYDDPSQAKEICAQEGSDDKLISHEDCNKYYQCVWGGTIVRDCPTNLYYNPKNGQCDWQSNVDCTNVGVINPDWTEAEIECSKGSALVAHEYCNWFYKCGPKGPIPIPCEDGTVFDSKWQTCNWPIFVDCGDKLIKPKEVAVPESEEEAVPEPEEVVVPEPEEVVVPEPEEVVVPEPEEVAVPEPEEVAVPESQEEVDDVIIELPDTIA